MTRKLDAPEPLLSAVARKLGQAAGTLANMSHLLMTDQTTRESHSPSKPKSVKKEKRAATVRQNRTTKQRHTKAAKRTRTARSRTASRRSTTGTKRAASRKR
jgi:hypothetical protein